MKVILANHAGYCYGVERAFNIVEVAATSAQRPITTLGPLIHNTQAIDALREERNVSIADSLDEIEEGTVVIRTHGVPPDVLESAEEKGLEVIDATCPFVRSAQKLAAKLVEEGYTLVVLGEKNHPEVIGVTAHAGGEAIVVEDPDEISQYLPLKRVGVVVQTTQQLEKLEKLVRRLLPHCKDLKVQNTICYATVDRQDAARKLARDVQAMIVVGGRHSGNTRRLVDICKEGKVPVHHIETADELDKAAFNDIDVVGVTAGASTPDFIIEDVVRKLESF
ncbi:MAG: 4-hydroxy-3-methylbut-2-enyl diphosphate reductase [Candidatus Latescibacteria bacterium]|nr:4-hydroxy-3-methylbut-2-enyl diphosphate reductase [Candidatus Latescibacterota bacterium]NIM66287.1 4-hydroxy-3-methylbut-2-enyl diphosphate reductase [Candidatus Latescibacterota bacterium]NIO02768.1 4-hydroxy-3-methylbut-2-enyl diphosphate reductase [Candidatus Latescibacterota bacterium]NIO29903.1 4-hydroxy-3-methylbut-2-enyl diphosphate reductase [Candidatus Latescibacterota bacterium]NIO57517.1 4-hydroxy-3-methylbut-2-enyl diphosphate reductase [Candidatus Latescibacterota bacterium]